jgi:hypothetical protein
MSEDQLMNDMQLLMLRLLGDDKRMIAYRPRLRAIAGSVTATILLQQILYRWEHNDFKPFYKYKEPCGAKDYRKGDSWCEELGFSREEFDTALRHIGQKEFNVSSRDPGKLVYYWTMPDRKTWYEVNYVTLCNVSIPLYVERYPHATKSVIPTLPIYTKNTTETTTETTADDDDALALLVSEDRRDVRSGRADQAAMKALRRHVEEHIKAATGEAWDDLKWWLYESDFDRLRLALLWCEVHRERIMKDPDAIRDPVGFIRAGAEGRKTPGLHPLQINSVDATIDLILEIMSESEYTQ